MSVMEKNAVEVQRAELKAARGRGFWANLSVFSRLSGPGWLQSATTLGGGSLASALYLGVLGGFGFMWLQPVAMVLGIIMLAAISYVTLSIGRPPMKEINAHISPVLGYGWAIGSLLACLVFAMPQFALGVAAITQNICGASGASKGAECAITALMFAAAMAAVWLYARGGRGVKIFELLIKISVAAIVVCFFGVALVLWLDGRIDVSEILAGFVPNLSLLSSPSADFLDRLSALDAGGVEYWSSMIVSQQRDVVISAAAMAVGINMTFLLPYSMLKKGWDRDFRSLAIFDLSTGLFVPFLIATSCIVVASASQFHAKPAEGLAESAVVGGRLVLPASASESASAAPAPNLVAPYISLLEDRVKAGIGERRYSEMSRVEREAAINSLSISEKEMAAMLVKRDASNLSEALVPLVGEDIARYIFGFGVLGMAANALLMNMLICGVSFAAVFGRDGSTKWQLCGSLLIAASAVASVFFKGAKMWLVIYAGVAAMVLLPIASGAFLLIINSKKILGSERPSGAKRILWTALMAISLLAGALASLWVLWSKLGIFGPLLFAAFLAAVCAWPIFFRKQNG